MPQVLITCRPVDAGDYPPAIRDRWRVVEEQIGQVATVYPGSIVKPCSKCGIRVYVGPHQQASAETDKDAVICCMVCSFLSLRGKSFTFQDLGNTYRPA